MTGNFITITETDASRPICCEHDNCVVQLQDDGLMGQMMMMGVAGGKTKDHLLATCTDRPFSFTRQSRLWSKQTF